MGGMPVGVCAITLSLLRRAWTTSARPELADRICLGGAPLLGYLTCARYCCPWDFGRSSGFQWGSVGVRQLRSPASFRPLSVISSPRLCHVTLSQNLGLPDYRYLVPSTGKYRSFSFDETFCETF